MTYENDLTLKSFIEERLDLLMNIYLQLLNILEIIVKYIKRYKN